MTRHIIEQALTGAFVLAAAWEAFHGQWQAGQFFLMAAALCDFDDLWREPR